MEAMTGPVAVPGQPNIAAATNITGGSLYAAVSPTLDNGGSPLTFYTVQVTTSWVSPYDNMSSVTIVSTRTVPAGNEIMFVPTSLTGGATTGTYSPPPVRVGFVYVGALLAETTYYVRARTNNSVGASVWSWPAFATTRAASRPGVVSNVTALEITGGRCVASERPRVLLGAVCAL